MKKLFYLFFAILFFICIILPKSKSLNTISDKSNIYRLHIIANSNSQPDQAVKLQIRDEILAYERTLFENDKTISNAFAAKELLLSHAYELYGIACCVLEKNDFDYSVKLSTGTYNFPDKTYGNVLYPAGDYDALRVVLGDGKGENWWCVMFPPLCIIDSGNGKSEDKEAVTEENNTVEFKSIFPLIGKWFSDLFR